MPFSSPTFFGAVIAAAAAIGAAPTPADTNMLTSAKGDHIRAFQTNWIRTYVVQPSKAYDNMSASKDSGRSGAFSRIDKSGSSWTYSSGLSSGGGNAVLAVHANTLNNNHGSYKVVWLPNNPDNKPAHAITWWESGDFMSDPLHGYLFFPDGSKWENWCYNEGEQAFYIFKSNAPSNCVTLTMEADPA